MKKSLSVFLLMALVSSSQQPPEAIPAEYSVSQAKTLTLKQTTDDQPDEIIPDVDSTLIGIVRCEGANWNDHPEATDFPDVRAWAPYDLVPGLHGAYYYDEERFNPSFCGLDTNLTRRDIGLKYAFERKYYGR